MFAGADDQGARRQIVLAAVDGYNLGCCSSYLTQLAGTRHRHIIQTQEGQGVQVFHCIEVVGVREHSVIDTQRLDRNRIQKAAQRIDIRLRGDSGRAGYGCIQGTAGVIQCRCRRSAGKIKVQIARRGFSRDRIVHLIGDLSSAQDPVPDTHVVHQPAVSLRRDVSTQYGILVLAENQTSHNERAGPGPIGLGALGNAVDE